MVSLQEPPNTIIQSASKMTDNDPDLDHNDNETNPEPIEHQLCKNLAHNDLKTRKSAFNTIPNYLSKNSKSFLHQPINEKSSTITQINLEKLWKGLFYMMWHSDKLPVQDKLAKDMSMLIYEIDFEEKDFDYLVCYLNGFFVTMSREWHGLDRYRVSKFLRLIRFTWFGGGGFFFQIFFLFTKKFLIFKITPKFPA